jgi:hypothetical protein
MEQSDSQLMMAARRRLSRLDARRSEHALLTWDHPGIAQEEIEAPTSLDQLGKRDRMFHGRLRGEG